MRIHLPILLALPLLAGCSGDAADAVDPTLVHTVERADLVITVRERGELQAARDTRVSSELEGRATLIYLIPEGSLVETGTKLAELDVSAIEEKRAMQAIAVARAEAALLQARKNVEIMEKELLAAESTAESRLQIAKLRLQKFLGQPKEGIDGAVRRGVGTNEDMVARLRELLEDTGTSSFPGAPSAEDGIETIAAAMPSEMPAAQVVGGPSAPAPEAAESPADSVPSSTSGEDVLLHGELLAQVLDTLGPAENLELEMGELSNQVLQLMDEINLARADLELAKDTLQHSRRLEEQQFITRNELARDEITYKRQLSRKTVAWNNLSLLIKYTLPETLITLQQEVENAALGLESVRAAGEARRVRDEAELAACESEYRLAKEQLDTLVEQTQNAVLRAPTPGLVVYGRWDWDEPVYEGMEVRERQEIVILPDITTMVAELSIHESQIGKLAVGQSATIRVDAFPSESLTGRVVEVASLPDATRRSSDPKVFHVEVQLDVDNRSGELRPSMNGTVVIDVGTLENVLTIPMPALDRSGDDLFVWRIGPDGPVATKVKLGSNNLTHVEVLEGLQEGDRIYLVRPPGARLPGEGWQPAKTGAEETGEPASEDDGGGGGAASGAGAGEPVLESDDQQR